MIINNYDYNNAIKYTERFWNIGLFRLYREKRQDEIINGTMQILKDNALKNGIKILFHNQLLSFNCLNEQDLNFKWKFKTYENQVMNGEYVPQENTLYLNANLRTNGMKAFETIYHEFSHLIQNALSKHINEFEKDSPEYQYLLLIKNEMSYEKTNIDSFGISFCGELYLSKSKLIKLCDLRTLDLIDSFYLFQISERNAFDTGNHAYNYILELNKNLCHNESSKGIDLNRQKDATEKIQEEYDAPWLTYDDICYLFDCAKLNLILHKSPESENDIEAGITYDIAAFLKILAENDGKYQNLFNESNKAYTLGTFYATENKRFVFKNFSARAKTYEFINDFNMWENFDANDLINIDIETQRRNPKLIVSALFYDRENAISAIKDITAFKYWYYSDANNLSVAQQKDIASLLGEDFSPEIRDKENMKIKLYICEKNKEHIQNITKSNSQDHKYEGYYFNYEDSVKWKPNHQEKKSKKVQEQDFNR